MMNDDHQQDPQHGATPPKPSPERPDEQGLTFEPKDPSAPYGATVPPGASQPHDVLQPGQVPPYPPRMHPLPPRSYVRATVVVPQRSKPFPRWIVPLGLYIATWLSCTFAGMMLFMSVVAGIQYAAAIMVILSCHEAGHYFQARRYRVKASLPYFIPLPIAIFGTMGAVIRMDDHIPNRKALYDIGISGPLAGLIPALVCCVLGLYWSDVMPKEMVEPSFGFPILFQYLADTMFGQLPADRAILMHPLAMAGWVGLFITSLNLLPIGQLDGGHVLYAMMRRRANIIAMFLLLGIVLLIIYFQMYHWLLMLGLLLLMGPKHPPTHDDTVPLKPWRYVLGWATLAFLFLGFTPVPLVFEETDRDPMEQPYPKYVHEMPAEDDLLPVAVAIEYKHEAQASASF